MIRRPVRPPPRPPPPAFAGRPRGRFRAGGGGDGDRSGEESASHTIYNAIRPVQSYTRVRPTDAQ